VTTSHNQEFLAVDVGSARVGIARGASIAKLAEPLKTVPAGQAVEEIGELAKQSSASAIVAGLPRSLDGNDTDQTKLVRQWVADAKQKLNLPFYWQDEALTSQGTDDDAQAAAMILQDFLNTPETDRLVA
jgi:putative Holliday junction resolvase